jgi:predicted membrane-bound spermidine synthase
VALVEAVLAWLVLALMEQLWSAVMVYQTQVAVVVVGLNMPLAVKAVQEL